jgi:hypothetical protein
MAKSVAELEGELAVRESDFGKVLNQAIFETRTEAAPRSRRQRWPGVFVHWRATGTEGSPGRAPFFASITGCLRRGKWRPAA